MDVVMAVADAFKVKLKSVKDIRKQNGIHELTDRPNKAWEELQVNVKQSPVVPLSLDTPVSEDKIRFVCISDTHSKLDRVTVPDGDVLLHAGDFTMTGRETEVIKFNASLGRLPHPHKIVIAGNHELSFDKETCWRVGVKEPKNVKKLLTNCIYLEESSVTCCGIKIYGSPCQPEFMGLGFNIPRGEACMDVWNQIPDDTDILITHGPPVGFGDVITCGDHVGCVELLHTVRNRVKPKYHLFGHIHEGYGVQTDGTTIYINASTCRSDYRPVNSPIIFDMDLPAGFDKKRLAVSMEIERGISKTSENSLTKAFKRLSVAGRK